MLSFLQRKVNAARTENGGVTLFTSSSDCLDLFATIGALRHASEDEIKTRFLRAFAESPSLALKTLFFARDIRGGLGERRVFRTVLVQLAENMSASILKNIHLIPEYGRFDDLLVLLGTPCRQEALRLIANLYHTDMAALKDGGNISLLGKWLPSVNASSLGTVKNAKLIARTLHLSDAAYRKSLTALRAKIAIIENNLRLSDYTFSYAKQPSRAMMKYRKAFLRNDEERYQAYLDQVLAGRDKLKTGGLMPYEIVRPLLKGAVSEMERMALDASWKALEDFTNNENALVVVDGSGSMYQGGNPLPATVALSMAFTLPNGTAVFFRTISSLSPTLPGW